MQMWRKVRKREFHCCQPACFDPERRLRESMSGLACGNQHTQFNVICPKRFCITTPA
jgi:hypothetical protein